MILLELPTESEVLVSIFNLMGQEMKILVNEIKAPGFYTVHWDGFDKDRNKLASGIYFYTVKAIPRNGKPFVRTRKMFLMK